MLVIQYAPATFPNYENPALSKFEINSVNEPSPELSRFSCTIFTVEYNGTVYFGGNEDEGGLRKNTEVRIIPAEDETTYGRALFGFVDNEVGGNDVDGIGISGINEKGLCFDSNGLLPIRYVESNIGGQSFANLVFWEFILSKCASVSEVIDWYQTHNMGGWWGNQIHWADSTGAAVVISANGTVAFTEKMDDDSFLISTNFNLADYSHGSFPCWRYTTVTDLLNYYVELEDVTIYNLNSVLDNVHLSGTSAYIGTAYTHIFNLNTCEIYVYILGNYDEVLHINLTEELAEGKHSYRLTDDLISSLSPKTSPGFNLLRIFLWLIPMVRWNKKKNSNK